MKEIYVVLSQYNLWANSRLADLILSLPEEKVNREIISSFPGLRLTLLHMWNAESVWWQRIKPEENIHLPFEEFDGSLFELVNNWKLQSKQWINWLESATEAAIAHEFIYRDSKKNRYKQPVSEVLQHLFIHQSYHRGQLVTILRQLEITEIPATDFIYFLRKKKT